MNKKKVFLGIGSGAIQLGLWAPIASEKKCRVVLTDIDDEKIAKIRKNGGYYYINVATKSGIKQEKVGPIEIYNPSKEEERLKIIEVIAEANDIVTAVPSVVVYEKGGIGKLLEEGLKNRKSPVAIYASENTVGAAKLLEQSVVGSQNSSVISTRLPARQAESQRAEKSCNINYLDTVIGKMCGIHKLSEFPKPELLAPLTPGAKEAILVEEFNKIIIEPTKFISGAQALPRRQAGSACDFETIFSELIISPNIPMWEDLKLYGHNAVHFLMGTLASQKGYKYMSEIAGDKEIMKIGRDALIDETGAWFKKEYADSGEDIVTEKGYLEWAKDLLSRIVNPYLFDSVERVIRDPERKLGFDDRIIGAIRKIIGAGFVPKNYILGVKTVLRAEGVNTGSTARQYFQKIWGDEEYNSDEGKELIAYLLN